MLQLVAAGAAGRRRKWRIASLEMETIAYVRVTRPAGSKGRAARRRKRIEESDSEEDVACMRRVRKRLFRRSDS